MKKVKENFGKIILIIILVIIFTISLLISVNTKYNSHPDEKEHYKAAMYFKNHNMPPKFTSNEIIDTFSSYGESRLTELDSYYFFVGKYTSIFSGIITSDEAEVFIARSFNLILLAILFVICYKLYKNKNYLFMPFLITSQLWYVFTYVNNDAWAVFLNMIFIYQLFYKESCFNKLMKTSKIELKEKPKLTITKFILLGLLFYSLLTAKTNYLIATGISSILYLIVNNKTMLKKDKLLKIGTILLVGILCLGIRLGIDYSINRLDRIKNMEQIRLSRASEKYLPPYEAGNFKWKEKGISFDAVIKNKTFYIVTLKSFIGVYGYMNKYAPDIFYNIIFASYIFFISYIIFYNIRNRKLKGIQEGRIIPIILAIFSGCLVLALSIIRAYTYDFQPQGRYLFPIIPLICANMYNQKKNKLLEIFFFIIAIVLIIMYAIYGYSQLIQ